MVRWLLFLLVLGGCQTLPDDPASGCGTTCGPEADYFVVVGKMALKTPDTSQTARFRLDNQGEAYDLELWGPFGQGRTRLQGTANQLSILDGSGRLLDSGPPDRIMRRRLGWEIPISTLVYWAQGRLAPDAPAVEVTRDAQGRLQGLMQSGWRVEYLSYQTLPSGAERPRTLNLTRPGYRARLIFNRWEDQAH